MSQGRTAACLRSLPGCAPAAGMPGSQCVPHPPTLAGRCWYLLGHETFRSVSRVRVLVGKAPTSPIALALCSPVPNGDGCKVTKHIPAKSGIAFTLPTNRLFQVEPGRLPPMHQVCPKPTSPGKAAPAGPAPAKQLKEGRSFSPPLKGSHSRPCSS